MVGGIKPRAFKNDAYWLVNLAQCFLIAFRAARQDRIAELLLAIKLDPTIFTTIGVNWLTTPQLYQAFRLCAVNQESIINSLAYLLEPIHYSALKIRSQDDACKKFLNFTIPLTGAKSVRKHCHRWCLPPPKCFRRGLPLPAGRRLVLSQTRAAGLLAPAPG
jgi:hypothetical protein